MKTSLFLNRMIIVALVALLSTASAAEILSAMGPNAGDLQYRDEKFRKGQAGADAKSGDREDVRHPEAGEPEKSKDAEPGKKKPRLKYRDRYECSC